MFETNKNIDKLYYIQVIILIILQKIANRINEIINRNKVISTPI